MHPHNSPATGHPLPSDDLNEWNVLVGRVVGTWDRAALKIKPFSTTPGRFAAGAKLCAAPSTKTTPATTTALPTTTPPRRLLTVQASRKVGHSWILDCGLSAAAEAAALRGAELLIHPAMRSALPEGEFYLDQLLGLRVRTEAGEDLGEIEEVIETPAHDVYVTPLAMIPGHAEFIVATDFENKVLIVRHVPGLKVEGT